MAEEFIDYFEMLGVGPQDDPDRIAGQFRRKAKDLIPLESTCHNCKGIGAIASYICDECDGAGVLKKTSSIRLEVPASAPDGTLLTKELDDHKIVIRVTYE